MEENLGFDFKVAKNGNVLIYHWHKLATTLRGKKAIEFVRKIEKSEFASQQQLMARLTGNYKRGNERKAKNHPKNH
ncbi:MAG: hypothetical protein AAF490_26180 [Chloroflexota bacterium]